MKKSIFLQLFILLFSFNTKTFSQCIDSANPLWDPIPTNNPLTATLTYNLTPTANVTATVTFTGAANTFSNNGVSNIASFIKSATSSISITYNTIVSKPSAAQGMAQSFNISNIGSSRGQIITGFDVNSNPVYPEFANTTNIVISGTNMNEISGSPFLIGSADFTFQPPIKSISISPKSGVTAGNVNMTFKQICASVPTPVELIFFKAKVSKNIVILNWQTASEKNNKGFEILRSVDTKKWENIGEIKGQGESNIIIDYSFEDKHPLSILTYYRLKQVDFDGKESYSNIESVALNKKDISFEIYPNPIINKEATIILDEDLLDGTLTIINSIGSIVKKDKIYSKNLTLDLTNLTTGVYIFNLQKDNIFYFKKIIIAE